MLRTREERKEKPPKEQRLQKAGELGKGDLFAVGLLVPGRYVATDKSSGKSASIQVERADPRTPLRPAELEAVRVRVGEDGFDPGRVSLRPTQGLVFEVQHTTQLSVRLEEADGGAAEKNPVFRKRFER